MDILSQIVDRTREIIAERKRTAPQAQLEARIRDQTRKTLSLAAKLTEPRPHVIAEFKRKSPSRPNINLNADPADIAGRYEAGGASAISVLTEPDFFGGAPEDLRRIRARVNLPLLRKDFMVDPYQFYEARDMGADMVLLIARILEPAQLAEFTHLAHELGLETLCEVHNLEELEKTADAPIDFLGVNCRDLKKFETNLDRLVDIAERLPANTPWVAESGIHGPADLKRLHQTGYQLFLIGEYLMKSDDPAARLQELIAP